MGCGDNIIRTCGRRSRRSLLLTLDRTAFFPEGGGQSCDTGFIGPYRVTDVQEREGLILHTVQRGRSDIPAAGTALHCSLDWERRFDNMQRHCGEHILSGIFYDMFGGINRGFHMGSDYMTVDISLEEDPRVTEITMKDAVQAELAANKVIWSDAPVTVMHFDDRREAEKLPLRKALAFDEDISIVCVGSPDNAADCVACCGTHPSSAGQVGIIKIFKVEKYKGMFRIYFEAGKRALDDYDSKHRLLTEISGRYSSSFDELPKKLDAREQKLAAVKDELFTSKKHISKASRLSLRTFSQAHRHPLQGSSSILFLTFPWMMHLTWVKNIWAPLTGSLCFILKRIPLTSSCQAASPTVALS